jgi:DHHC palmitoyltransferase
MLGKPSSADQQQCHEANNKVSLGEGNLPDSSYSPSSISDSKESARHSDVESSDNPQESTRLLATAQDASVTQLITVQDFHFPPSNPTIQRYYRFTPGPLATFAALHKRPGQSDAGSVAGVLHRAAVVPSHGTDRSGDWILVSVGGRSGWARKRRTNTAVGGFVLARQFQGFESWTGNHMFLCGGKIMMGSDGPLFLFTNVLLIGGVALYLFWLLPKLEKPFWLLSRDHEMIFTGFLFLVGIITFWICATMDPGILPAHASPIKPTLPSDAIGGPLGYRYCATCNIFRPPRSKHCNSCNVCVSKFDQYVNLLVYVKCYSFPFSLTP